MDSLTDSLIRHIETAVTLPLCLLTVLIVHECGHYFAARLSGMRVESVTLGRGKLMFRRTDAHGTVWSWHLWPVRAHVHIADFQNPLLSMRRKLFVILAGPMANFVLPFFLFFAFFAAIGQPAIPTIVTGIEPDMPAYQAGLRPGDRIVSINAVPVRSMEDIQSFTHRRPDRPLRIRYERDGASYDASVMPVWFQYRDLEGVPRAHGRIGLTTWQQSYKLEVVKSVNGVPTPTEDSARAELLRHMGQRVTVGLASMDGKVYDSLIDVSAAANRNLSNPDHREHGLFYLGSLRDNIYLPLSVTESVSESAHRSAEMLSHILRLPFNLFPIDREWITPDAVVSRETSWVQVRLYTFVFFAALCSCLIGFLNLLPFPKLDGGEALLLIAERWKRRPLELKEKRPCLSSDFCSSTRPCSGSI